MEKSWAAVVRDGNTEIRAVGSTNVTHDVAGAVSTKKAEEQDVETRELDQNWCWSPIYNIKIFPYLTHDHSQALPSKNKNLKKAREPRLGGDLRGRVATTPVPMRNLPHPSTDEGKQVMETYTQEARRGECLVMGNSRLSDHNATEIEEDEFTKDMPEHLVEMIIAMIPFPSIFKAKCLSRSWLVKFSPVASLDDEAHKVLAGSFQKLVGESSGKWQTFWPISPVTDGNERFFSYDRASEKWQILPPFNFITEDVGLSWYSSTIDLEIDGALLHGCYGSSRGCCGPGICHRRYGLSKGCSHERGLRLFVANILTRSWKNLPVIDTYADTMVSKKLVRYRLSEYKMFLLCERGRNSNGSTEGKYDLHIYDSNSGSWITKNFVAHEYLLDVYQGYLNGVLYTADNKPVDSLLALAVELGTFDNFKSSNAGWDWKLIVCNGILLMISQRYRVKSYYDDDFFVRSYHLSVSKIDIVSGQLSELALSPVAFDQHYEWDIKAAVSDGKCILFRRGGSKEFSALAYNVKEDKWSTFRVLPVLPPPSEFRSPDEWCSFSFQPGLDPFMTV